MRVLSIDVGIKNLAYCLLEINDPDGHFSIKCWDIANLSSPSQLKCCIKEKNKDCMQQAKFKNNLNFFCTKHAKKEDNGIRPNDLKLASIKKQNVTNLVKLAGKYNLDVQKPHRKNEILSIIENYTLSKFCHEIESINCKKLDLIEIGMNLKIKFNEIFDGITSIDYIIIENQISPIANRMKTIQGMIVQYFIMSDIFVENMEFVSAKNKLKEETSHITTKYSERKKMSITKCKDILLSDYRFSNQETHFVNHRKKDDLADSFLQAMWYINENKL